MTKHIINLSLISKISIVDKQRCKDLYWKKELVYKILGFTIWTEKAGYYCDDALTIYSLDALKEGYYKDVKFLEENKVLYFRPYVKLFVGKDCILCQEFDTFEEALVWGKKQAKRGMASNCQLEISR